MVLKGPALYSDWSTVYVYYALPKEDRRGWLDRFPRGEHFDEIVAALRLPHIQTNESDGIPPPTNDEIESALVELNEVRALTEQMGNEAARQSRLRLIESKIATFEKLRR